MVSLMGGKAVQPYSAKLVEAVLPHLRHRHAAVRVATLDALEHALLAGAGSSVRAKGGKGTLELGLRERGCTHGSQGLLWYPLVLPVWEECFWNAPILS
jgi:hypothetical protein